MGVTFENAVPLFRAGRFAEIAAASPTREELKALTPEQRLVFARALVYAAKNRQALQIIEEEDRDNAPPRVRARCRLLLGSLARAKGELTASEEYYRSASQLAHEARDHETEALATIQLFRLLTEVHPTNAVAAMVPEMRRRVIRVGDPQLSAYMHGSVAVSEATNGRLSEARRHLHISASLLAADPNAWIEQGNYIASFFICYYECRYLDALAAIERARALLAITGEQQKRIIDGNYGHVLAVLGRFDQAARVLRTLATEDSGLAQLGALDGLARIALSRGNLGECESALAELERMSASDPMLASAYGRRWTAVTRLKLLIRKGNYDEASRLAEDLWADARSLRDPLLKAHIQHLRTEALALSGRIADASTALFAYSVGGEWSTPEQYPIYCRAAGHLLLTVSDSLARELLDRAAAVWTEQQNISATSEIDVVRTALNASAARHRESAQDNISIVSSLASVFNLASNPRLIGRELLHVIDAAKCRSLAAHIEVRRSNHTDLQSRNDALVLGSIDNKTVALTFDVPNEPRAALLLRDLMLIAKSAVELERYRQEERNRAALWPADPIETEAGALFLAEEMQTLLSTARRIAPTNVPVLITGETGTGKEVLARLIHAYSTRAKAAFLPFNCSATPKDMLDSQLFGHRRGAFTGATDSFPGVIRAAAGGTLFLDEIGETTLDVQPKLLRFLEAGEVHPIGEAHPIRADVRVIAATNADLDAMVSEARFRDDLFYRLNIVRLHVPPLRERRVEIPALANHYLRKYAKENGKGDLRLAEETMEYLVLYRWPGNVRQLANEMRRMAALAESGAVLMPEHLSHAIASSRRTIPASERTLEPTEVVVRLDQPMAAAVQHVERALILYAMKQCGGGMEETAAMLGLSRKGLYLKRQRYAIESPGEAAAVA